MGRLLAFKPSWAIEAAERAAGFIEVYSTEDAAALRYAATSPGDKHDRLELITNAQMYERIAETVEFVSLDVLEEFGVLSKRIDHDTSNQIRIDLSLANFQSAEEFAIKFIAEAKRRITEKA